MRNLLVIALVVLVVQLTAASQNLGDGERVLFYTDGLLDGLIDAAEDQLKEDIKKRKISWDVKAVKKGKLADVNADIEKNVLKKKPQHVVLAFGIYDICDPKKLSVNDFDLEKMIDALDTAVAALKEAGINVVLTTPGLAGETLSDEHQRHLDGLAEKIRVYASEKQLRLCDVRKKAVTWLAANPPKKAGRLQLTKKGGKWDDLGEELFASEIMRGLGLSKSGIKRALKWDEKVVLGTSMAEWQAGIEKEMIAVMREAGPKEAPKGFFNPGIKGPTYVHLSVRDIEREDYDPQAINQQRPSVLFLYPFHRLTIHTHYSMDGVSARLDQVLKFASERDYPAFMMTPFWCNEDGQKALGEKGKRYQRCKELAEMTRAAAAKFGVPVIDLFALCEQEHAADPSKVFWGLYEADPKSLSMYPDGKALYGREMKRVLGILKEE